jgi:hypothetical protein
MPPSSQAPDSAANSAAPAASEAPIVEGCLSGAAPDFVITDKAGTAYKLVLPARADPAQLTSHVGQTVQAQGLVGGASAGSSTPSSSTSTSTTATAAPSGTSASSSSGGQHTIQVTRMAKVSDTCSKK